MSGAVWEALEAARAAGVEDWLREDIIDTFVRADEKLIDRLVDGTAKHAARRAHEMHDAAALLAELGVPAPIANATAEALERFFGEEARRCASRLTRAASAPRSGRASSSAARGTCTCTSRPT